MLQYEESGDSKPRGFGIGHLAVNISCAARLSKASLA
jgi:hypothetical protein